jgi:hypothetical protein
MISPRPNSVGADCANAGRRTISRSTGARFKPTCGEAEQLAGGSNQGCCLGAGHSSLHACALTNTRICEQRPVCSCRKGARWTFGARIARSGITLFAAAPEPRLVRVGVCCAEENAKDCFAKPCTALTQRASRATARRRSREVAKERIVRWLAHFADVSDVLSGPLRNLRSGHADKRFRKER